MRDNSRLTVSRSLLLIQRGGHGEHSARAENVGRIRVVDTSCEAGLRVEDGEVGEP
jgi:hypothetical protein